MNDLIINGRQYRVEVTHPNGATATAQIAMYERHFYISLEALVKLEAESEHPIHIDVLRRWFRQGDKNKYYAVLRPREIWGMQAVSIEGWKEVRETRETRT